MISSRLAAGLARKDIHYGWVVVAMTFLTMLATAGAMGAPGVLIGPLQREFGWQTGDISLALGDPPRAVRPDRAPSPPPS